MDFDFTDDQVSLRDAVQRWVEKGFSFERRHALAKAGGAPQYEVATWYGIWAPKGTPREAVAAMQAEMRKALNGDELKATWTSLGTETPNLWGDDFGKFVGAEIKRWADVVKASGVKLD